jgi:predicted DNA-binding transcriptional regulator AlpA
VSQQSQHKTLLRVAEAAAFCGLSVSTMAKRRLAGKPPIFRKIGFAVRYDVRDLDDFLVSCTRHSTAEDAGSE